MGSGVVTPLGVLHHLLLNYQPRNAGGGGGTLPTALLVQFLGGKNVILGIFSAMAVAGFAPFGKVFWAFAESPPRACSDQQPSQHGLLRFQQVFAQSAHLLVNRPHEVGHPTDSMLSFLLVPVHRYSQWPERQNCVAL